MEHKPFNFSSYDDFSAAFCKHNPPFKLNRNISVLSSGVKTRTRPLYNRIAFQAMEGCDGDENGAPGELTVRRYLRFAASGAAFIYIEASAVDQNGRANPRQLMLNENTLDAYKSLISQMRKTAADASLCEPYIAVQLTHSGRYTKDENRHGTPRVIWPDPERDPSGANVHVMSDDELDMLCDKYVNAARLARLAGFDAVDIKCCHGYLLGEMLGARLRTGKYGGSFENRTRLIDSITKRVRDEVGIEMMVRLSGYDEYPYPLGFGVSKYDFHIPDLTEVKMLVDLLIENGVAIIDVTAGNPYYNPHVNRPYDLGTYIPPLSQFEQIFRHFNTVRELKSHNPNAIYIASMFTWFRQYAPYVAAAGIENGCFDMAGFGRQSFAYPDFPKDIFETGEMDAKKCCVACSKCTALMRTGNVSGCVVRDKIYTDIYTEIPSDKRPANSKIISERV